MSENPASILADLKIRVVGITQSRFMVKQNV